MSFINITDVSPQKVSQSIQNFKLKELANLFSKGEVLDAVVSEKLGQHKVLLDIKGQSVIADTEISLRAGEKISVKVDQLRPNVTLRIMENKPADLSSTQEAARLKEYLMLLRANPEALKKIVTDAKEIFTTKLPQETLNAVKKEDVQVIIKLLESLVFSKASAANPEFVKEFVANLGMSQENSLLEFLNTGTKNLQLQDSATKDMPGKAGNEGLVLRQGGENLKGQLLKLSQEMTALLGKKEIADDNVLQKLTKVVEFANSTVKSVEAQQVANVMLQENDSSYMLQIPLQLPGGIRTAELYIETDRDSENANKAKKQFRIVFFLDMDAMGMIMIDAGIRDRNIGCMVKCEDEDVQAFITEYLPELSGKLAERGYEVEYLTCGLEKRIDDEKREYVAAQSLSAQDIVNLFA